MRVTATTLIIQEKVQASLENIFLKQELRYWFVKLGQKK